MAGKESTRADGAASDGAQVGWAKNGTDETVHFSDEMLKQHHLYIGTIRAWGSRRCSALLLIT